MSYKQLCLSNYSPERKPSFGRGAFGSGVTTANGSSASRKSEAKSDDLVLGLVHKGYIRIPVLGENPIMKASLFWKGL